jgi:CubicO group peptidase (beta-lactamase class C family)
MQLLIDKMGFDGLILTDALNMAGVANSYGPGEVELASFKAGNDILLMPSDLEKARTRLKSALRKEEISEDDLDYKVRKILMAKYWLNLKKEDKVDTKNIVADLNSIKAQVLRKQLMQEAVTLVINKERYLPIKDIAKKKYACITLGVEQGEDFAKTLNLYTEVDHFSYDGKNGNEILNKLSEYDMVFVGIYTSNKNPWKSYKIKDDLKLFVKKVSLQTPMVITVFANPYSLRSFEEKELAQSLIMAYQNNPEAEQAAAQMIFGAINAKGKIPVNSSSLFDAGYGIERGNLSRLAYALPEEVGIDREKLSSIDSIAEWAIAQKATPGCQILIAKEGKVFYHKNFGHQTYDKYYPIDNSSIYDLASITKIAATLPVLMELYEEGNFSLDDPLVKLLPETKGSNKSNLKVNHILTHKAGLEPWVPFFLATLEDQKPSPKFYSSKPNDSITTIVARDLFIKNDYEDVMFKTILQTGLGKPKYKYSDLGYYFFKKYIEKTLKTDIEDYVQKEIYEPLGASTLGYLPRNRFDEKRLVPTEHDKYFRYQLIRGYVHDQGASMTGGIGGHAGLFSNANDLAKLMQMYLQEGYYGGKQYLRASTIKEFTKCEFCKEDNRRGLGFDKPQLSGPGPACDCVSKLSFGHTGFTGTIAWADPDQEIIYIFLSNRVYPDAENKKLITSSVRTKIQEEIYKSLNTYTP